MKLEMKETSSMVKPSTATASNPRERAIAKLLENGKAPEAESQAPAPTLEAEAPKAAESNEDLDPEFEKAKVEAQKLINEADDSVTPKEAPKASEEPISSQYALLARKDKIVRQKEVALKAREAELKAKEDAMSAKSSSNSSFDESKYISKEKLSADVFGTLTEMGFTYDQLTEAALNGPKPKDIEMMNEIKALREEMKALKGESESTKKTFDEYQTQNETLGINQLTKQATSLINNNPNFETIKETGSINDVVDLIKTTLKEDGVILSVEEAAEQVEEYLVEEALKLARIKKIQQKLAPQAAAPKAADAPKQQQLKTLTNSVGTSRPLSARERAILAAEGRLNK